MKSLKEMAWKKLHADEVAQKGRRSLVSYQLWKGISTPNEQNQRSWYELFKITKSRGISVTKMIHYMDG